MAPYRISFEFDGGTFVEAKMMFTTRSDACDCGQAIFTALYSVCKRWAKVEVISPESCIIFSRFESKV